MHANNKTEKQGKEKEHFDLLLLQEAGKRTEKIENKMNRDPTNKILMERLKVIDFLKVIVKINDWPTPFFLYWTIFYKYKRPAKKSSVYYSMYKEAPRRELLKKFKYFTLVF
uniref:Uncharacterized protein n=1 Tax=Romanomermis culicivorax TaxID=13658 RepID=A0A915J563_ROMCU